MRRVADPEAWNADCCSDGGRWARPSALCIVALCHGCGGVDHLAIVTLGFAETLRIVMLNSVIGGGRDRSASRNLCGCLDPSSSHSIRRRGRCRASSLLTAWRALRVYLCHLWVGREIARWRKNVVLFKVKAFGFGTRLRRVRGRAQFTFHQCIAPDLFAPLLTLCRASLWLAASERRRRAALYLSVFSSRVACAPSCR